MNETDETKSRPVLDADDASRERALDRALAAAREEMPPVGSETAAAGRVARSLGLPGSLVQLTDYQTLIPDYLAGRLNDAQGMLFEEELRTSIPLRRALAAARGGEGADHGSPTAVATGGPRPDPRSARNARRWGYALAASIVVAIGAAVVLPTLSEPDPVRLARAENVDGMSLRQVGTQWLPLAQGEWIDDGQRLATKQNGSAMLEFEDGSKVEVAPRSQLRLTRERRGNRIRVDQGRVIVQVAPQRDGTFDVVTDDLLVAVVGTTLGVGHGTKGSRVSVIEGEVEVRHDGKTTSLQAGDQYRTRKTTATALKKTVAWSRDAERYSELLRAYADFQRDIGEALTAENRHSTRLLDLVPTETSVYVAVPNAPATIAEAYAAVVAFHDRLPAGEFSTLESSAEVGEMVGWLGEVGDHLGPETVLALHRDDADKVVLLLLAEARKGLRNVIEDKLLDLALAVGNQHLGFEIVDDPDKAQEGRLSIWIHDGLFAASASPAALVQLHATMDDVSNPFRKTDLYARLVEVYDRGAEYVAGADMAKLGLDGFQSPLFDLRGARTAVAEYRLDDQVGVAALEVRFDEDNPDRVAILDQPGPMGALRFFSPDATLVSAVVLPDSERLMAALDTWLDLRPTQAEQPDISEIVDGLVGMLGGEIAIALDGPILPRPSWKAVVEVYDPFGLQQSIESWLGLVRVLSGDEEFGVVAVEGTAPHESIYRLTAGGLNIHYAYIDGYLVVAGNRAVLDRARFTYESGTTLLDAAKFQELFPLDSYLNFSAVTYARLDDSLVLPVLRLATSASDGNSSQILDQLQGVLAGGAAMFGVYNEPDRIRLVANGTNIAPFYGLPMLPALGAGVSDTGIEWRVQTGVDVGDEPGQEDGT